MKSNDDNLNVSEEHAEHNHALDVLLRGIDKVVRFGSFVTVGLGLAYAFFFRDVTGFRPWLLTSFFATAALGCVWSLLIAIRELSVGMRTRVTAGVIWTAIFWGSFGIVGLAFLAIIVRVVLR